MDLESDLKKVSLINRNKFVGLEKAQGKSRDLSQPQQPKHFRVLRQKASSLQKIISRWDEAGAAQSSYWSVREILFSDRLIEAGIPSYIPFARTFSTTYLSLSLNIYIENSNP